MTSKQLNLHIRVVIVFDNHVYEMTTYVRMYWHYSCTYHYIDRYTFLQ